MNDTALNSRGADGAWRPPYPVPLAPINDWPPRPARLLKWLFGWQGYLWPENLLWLGVTLATWTWLTPDLVAMKTIEAWWVGALLVRNAVLIGLLYGGLHYFLYLHEAQGARLRYSTKPFPTDSGQFKFRRQVRDNVFHTMVYGVPTITAYEAATYWLFANGHLPFATIGDPVAFWGWFVVLLLAAPVVHAGHFYAVHRLLHTKALYKPFHALHHNNVEVGPWSGLSMHPVEHLLYFSGVVVQWLWALHPVNTLYQSHLAALYPAPGHSGFEKVRLFPGLELNAGSYFHYMHHQYFECNYGGSLLPFDRWFGTYHDGTPESLTRMRDRIKARRQANGMG